MNSKKLQLSTDHLKTPSISSHHISIETLPDNCDSSSASETDSDDDDFIKNSQYIIESSKTPRINKVEIEDGTIVLEQNLQQPGPTIGSVCVRDATDITFGNKTLYEGPVTIKHMTVKNDKKHDGES